MNGTWISPLINDVMGQLRDDEYWRSRVGSKEVQKRSYHLAVFTQPLFQFVLDGKKTVESRFSIVRCAPYCQIQKGDVVFVKGSGGPVKAIAEVGNVWFYRLDKKEMQVIRNRFGELLCVSDDFWQVKAGSLYATLMCFSKVRQIEPVQCAKKDRRGWVVLQVAEGRQDGCGEGDRQDGNDQKQPQLSKTAFQF